MATIRSNPIPPGGGTGMWRSDSPLLAPGVTLRGMWGSAANDLWAVGSNGTVLRSDGKTWCSEDIGTSAFLYDIWGVSATRMVIVGGGGSALHAATAASSYTSTVIPGARTTLPLP